VGIGAWWVSDLLLGWIILDATVRVVVGAGFETAAMSAYTETSMAIIYK
jgi:hypothetical protein